MIILKHAAMIKFKLFPIIPEMIPLTEMTRLLYGAIYEPFTPLLLSQAHVDHGQGGQGGKGECSLLFVFGAKVPFSNGKSFVPL